MSQYTYQNGRFYKDGKPFFVIASDYQYYRDRRDHWEDRLTKLKESGVELITFYTPWRHHLQMDNGSRTYDFNGSTKDSRDLKTFLETVKRLDLLMVIKPGPFVHSELNVGGLPDLVSPGFNPGMPEARRHHGRACRWTYDNSQLPAPFDEHFDGLVKEWLEAVGEVIAPYCGTEGPCIAIQLNDETIYCMSNDPPWHIGYEPSGLRFYQQLLAERYGDVETYNRLHGTNHTALDFVGGPRLLTVDDSPKDQPPGPSSREEALKYADWGEYQWKLRREFYVRYAKYLGIDLPQLTNYAGITPPIEENVPDLQDEAHEVIPSDYQRLYPEWWFAMNRVDADRDDYEYGMISWLGVAAYDRDVFDRYVNTARRARGLNLEENWGFAALYDKRSKFPVIPFYQTLVSVAAGATGYDIFVGASTDYWDETLDRITKLQCPTFPSDAPIDEHGNLRPLYHTAKFLNSWFVEHGDALLGCEIDIDVAYLLYPPYAAVSSWVPDERYWRVADSEIPRCGREGFEEFSHSLQEAGYSFGMFELDAATEEQLSQPKALALQSGYFMDAASQERLAKFVEGGGRLYISGQLPEVDDKLEKCTRLKDAIEKATAAKDSKVIYSRDNFFADGKFAKVVEESGLETNVTYSETIRAYVHRGGNERFVFFFSFDEGGPHERWIEYDRQRIELTLGSKTSGVLRITDGKITGHMIKGANEVDETVADVRIKLNDQVIEGRGDFSSTG